MVAPYLRFVVAAAIVDAVAADKKDPVLRPVGSDVEAFMDAVPDERRRSDARTVAAIMAEVTGEPAVAWGGGIVGFGAYHYRYASGREGHAPLVGLAPRKGAMVVYLAGGLEDRYGSLLARLGPHRAGKGCLYLKTLDGIDIGALRQLIDRAVRVHRGVDIDGA
jgi:hypothetical protein